jgi:hypothetical protein
MRSVNSHQTITDSACRSALNPENQDWESTCVALAAETDPPDRVERK